MYVYLLVDEIVVMVCWVGVDVIYFGYGFLLENLDLVVVCVVVGISFVGFSVEVFELVGNKFCVIVVVCEVGLFVLMFLVLLVLVDELLLVVVGMLFLLFVKVVVGGGGWGMCCVGDIVVFLEVIEVVSWEVELVFGDLMVYFE